MIKHKPHVISTSAQLHSDIRTNQYIESFNQLKQFTDLFETITLIETVSATTVDYLENTGLRVYYSTLGNPYSDKGVNWVYHIEHFLKESSITDDEVIIFITGRYKLLNDNIVKLINDNMYNKEYDIIAKSDSDMYSGIGVHTFLIAFRKHKFLEFAEWYRSSGNHNNCVEWEMKKFMEKFDKCLILGKETIIGVETRIASSNTRNIC